MSDEIFFDGVRYISASEAADFAGLSRDYIARLCKDGKVLGRRVGKQWYVSRDALNKFILAQQYARVKRREELVETRRLEHSTGEIKKSSTPVFQQQSLSQADSASALSSAFLSAEKNASARRETYAERALRSAFAQTSTRLHTRAANLVSAAPMHVASFKSHVGMHAFPQVLDFLHKLTAISVAILFTIGTYLFVDAQYARIADRSSSFGASLMQAAQEQIAAVGENPTGALADAFRNFARDLNTRIDSFVYSIMFPRSLAEHSSGTIVAARVVSHAPTPSNQSSSPQSSTTHSSPAPSSAAGSVIERVIETQRIVSSAGGITEDILNTRLQELDNKLSSQIYAVASVGSANSTQIINNYNAVGGALRIDELSKITLKDSTITGGTISGATISSATFSGTTTLQALAVSGTGTTTFGGGIQATALNITSSASTTFANGLVVSGGCIQVNGTCITGGGTGGGSDTQVQFNNNGTLAGNAAFTFSSSTGLLKVSSASSTLLSLFDRLYVGGSATTTIRGDGVASSLPFASSTALSVSGTGYFGTASTTNLTVSGIQSSILSTNGSGSVGALTVGNGLSLSANALSTTFSTTSANTWTALQLFSSGASTTNFSNFGTAYFGGSATTTIDSSGNIAGVGTLTVSGLSALQRASTTLFSSYGPAYFGATATSSFSSAGALTLATPLLVSSGGTGASTFGQGWIFSSGGTGALSASTSPTVNYLTATSTSATSSIATGGFTVGSSQLVVQQTSGRVGIGTAAPTTGLDVDVATDISGNLTVSGGASLTVSATGPINQSGTGQVTFAGNVDATNGLDVTTANLTVGGSNFIVAPGTGNTTIAGSLTQTGAVWASSTLQATNAARFYSTLRTDDTLTAAGSGTGLSVTNNASVGGTLSVTGNSTLSGSLSVGTTLSAATTTLTGELSLATKKITGVATPSASTDAANKSYVDSIAQGLSLKDSVRAGTTANITLSGEQTIDGVALVTGNRVLVKNQNDQTKNGIYVVSGGSWSRSTDADTSAEVPSGMFTFISEGTVNANSGWVLTTANPITLDTSLLSFTQFSGAGQIIAGTGLTKSGNTLDVNGTTDRITANADSIDIASTYVGQTSITTVGTLTSGSLGSGFGNINIGNSTITGGAATFSSIVGSAITGSGNLTVSGTGSFTGNVSVSGTLSAASTTLSGDLAMSNKKITGLADPTSAQEAATKAYVDAIAQGLTVKQSVRLATTSNITLSGTQTIDGVSAIAGDRVLVMGQTTASANGIYVVASGAWSRSTDADENSEVVQGMYAFVTAGTAYTNTGWSLITANPITLGSTSLTFTQFSGSADVTAGDGLTKSGTTINAGGTTNRISVTADAIDISSSYVGQTSITTVGALTSGSIGSGFGSINIGSNALTAGAGTFTSLVDYGTLTVGGTATTTIQGNSATSTFSGGISLAAGNVNLATGGAFLINNALALNATTLGSSVLSSSLTSVGALDSGSITTGFGAINIGSDTLDAGTTTIKNLVVQNTSSSTFAGGVQTVGVTSLGPSYFGATATSSFSAAGLLTLASGGSASAPIITFSGDTNNGIFSSASDVLNFTTNGSERARFDSGGLFSLGTTTPFWALTVASSTGPQLALTDTTSSSNAWTLRSIGNSLYIATSTATATSSVPSLAINPNGFVGLSTSSPGSILSIQNTANFTPATTTIYGNLEVKGSFRDDSVTSALILDDAAGLAGAYGGTSCTNQFIRSLNGSGVATCSTASLTADVTGTLPIANGGTNASSQTSNGVNYYDGTKVTSGSQLFFNGTQFAVGTTTPFWNLTAASSTGPQLALIDQSASSSIWTLRSISNSLYFATSTPTATSSTAALAFNASTGAATFGSPATSTFTGALQTTYLNVTGSAASSTFVNGIQVAGGIAANLGAVGAPSYTFIGDLDTGAWSPGSNALAFSTGGSERVRIDSSGNVGIGTTSPQTKLEVVNTSSGATADELYLSNLASATSTASRLSFRTQDIVNNAGTTTAAITGILQQNYSTAKGDLVFSTMQSGVLTEVMRATSAGYLGVGTTTPYRRLSVTDGGSSAPQLALGFNTSNDAQMMVDSTGALSIDASGNQVRVNNDNLWVCTGGSATTNGCPTGNPSGQGNLVIENRLGIGTSTLGVSGANYAFTLDLQNDSTTNLVSVSTSTSGYGTTRSIFTIGSNGYVGVSTSSPWARFTVGAGGAITTVENALTDAATITVNWIVGNQQRVTLGGNRTINFSNYISGQILRLVLCQDGTGSRTVTWGGVNWQGGSAPTLTTTANKCDLLTFVATYATSSSAVQVFGAAALNF